MIGGVGRRLASGQNRVVDDEPLFEPDAASPGTFIPSPYTRGPWDPGLLHGGPVGALFAERLQDAAGDEYQPARLTVELMRPVPLRPMRMRVDRLRDGRRLRVTEALLEADGKDVARATLLSVRPLPLDATGLNPPLTPPASGPDATDSGAISLGGGDAFVGGSMDFRREPQQELGRGVAWLRLHRDVLPGRAPSPLARAAAAADVGNAVSARWGSTSAPISFVNADLSVSLSRLPEGEWIRLEAEGRWEATGIGWVTSEMSDERGVVGRVSNALVLAPDTR